MKKRIVFGTLAALLCGASGAEAQGSLNVFIWGNVTPPELVSGFEKTYDVKVTLTDYDSNDTALAKVRQGGHGFDVVVPTSSYVPIWISEGLLLETRPDQMENFQHIDPKWVDVPFDPGRRYTVPYEIGATGIAVNRSRYKGDINTSAIFLDPPAELVGKINVVPMMDEVMHLAISYVGGEPCTTDKEVLRKVRDKLVEAKPKWGSIDYGTTDTYAKGDVSAGVWWSGSALRARLVNKDIRFGYPKEGFPLWMDNVAVLKDAKNVENAKLFQNYVMDPKNAALISAFTRYQNGSKASEAALPDEMKDAPEVVIPKESVAHGTWLRACPAEAQALYSKIWASIQN